MLTQKLLQACFYSCGILFYSPPIQLCEHNPVAFNHNVEEQQADLSGNQGNQLKISLWFCEGNTPWFSGLALYGVCGMAVGHESHAEPQLCDRKSMFYVRLMTLKRCQDVCKKNAAA